MIKGINHTMIELNETGNEYYERALLIVKPEYASVARAVLEDEAKKMLSELDVPSAIRAKRKKMEMDSMYDSFCCDRKFFNSSDMQPCIDLKFYILTVL